MKLPDGWQKALIVARIIGSVAQIVSAVVLLLVLAQQQHHIDAVKQQNRLLWEIVKQDALDVLRSPENDQ